MKDYLSHDNEDFFAASTKTDFYCKEHKPVTERLDEAIRQIEDDFYIVRRPKAVSLGYAKKQH